MADGGCVRSDPTSLYKESYMFEASMELCLPTCTNKTVTSKHQVIVCGLCTRWFHFACIGLPPGRPGGFTGTYLCLGCLAMLRDMHNHFKRARCKEKRVERLEATVTRLKADHVLLKGRLDKIDTHQPQTPPQQQQSPLAATAMHMDRSSGHLGHDHSHSPRIPVATAVSSVIQRVGRSAVAPTNGGHPSSHRPPPAHSRPAAATPTTAHHAAATPAPASHRVPRARVRNTAADAVMASAPAAGATTEGRARPASATAVPPTGPPTTNFLEEYLLGTRENPSPYTNVDPHKLQKGPAEERSSVLEIRQNESTVSKAATEEKAQSEYAREGHPPLVPKPDPDGVPATSPSAEQQQKNRSELMEVQVKVEPTFDEVMEVSDGQLPEPVVVEPLILMDASGSPGGRAPVIVAQTDDILRQGAASVWSDPASYMSDEGSYGSSGSASISTPLPPQPGISQESILKDLLLAGESKPAVLPETESLEEDDYLFCYDCRTKVLGHCTIHPLVILPDSEVAEDEHFQADLSIPKGLSIRNPAGQGAGQGVFADVPVPEGIVFGPYKGEIRPSTQGPRKREYCWKIVKTHSPSYTVDASNVEKSNWMRYVDTPDHTKFQNLVAFQYRGQIYYRTSIPIPAGTELVVWYGERDQASKRVHRSEQGSGERSQKNKLPYKSWSRDT